MTLDARRARDLRRSLPAKVVADGVDVSRVCFKADVRRRRLWLFVPDAEGYPQYGPRISDVLREERRVKTLKVTRRPRQREQERV